MRKISTLVGLIIIISWAAVAMGGAFIYQYYAIKDFESKITTGFPNALKQTVCPMYCVANMLCGSDGKDYCNECLAKSAGATISHEGKCKIK